MGLQYSTAYHPQTDGQSEVVNRCLETYLQCAVGDSTIQTTPFEALYGVPPPIHIPYVPGDSNVEAVDLQLRSRETAITFCNIYAQQSVMRGSPKFQAKYYGPYQIIECIGKTAYKLHLPSDALIHNVFHVSLSKPAHASVVASSELPPLSHQSTVLPQAILDRRMVKRKNAAATQFLVHWQSSSPVDAMWEFADDFQLHFPFFSLGTRNLGDGNIVTN
ncbi:uncharacterized protein [Elaeis guineensis]|uniref:uncharacterized protein n=1 Tax=Elaeis guineensis var. tenera TaxID=51953 RepID=UPI003C6D2A70